VAQSRNPESRELDELTLVRAQRGEDPACRMLVETYQRPVFALLFRVLGPARAFLVEDLAQETFLRAFRALAAFDRAGPARLSTWILTIATRLALDELRRRPVEPSALPPPAPPPRADEAAERRSVGDAIARAVGALQPEYRAAFVLREMHELSYEEIAGALAIDVGTVKSRLSRARAALREALAEVHDAD
jgi:RNA polymerase sigma-70 factor (ECF subfamily)